MYLLPRSVYTAAGDQPAGNASTPHGVRCVVYIGMEHPAPVWQPGEIAVGHDSSAAYMGAKPKPASTPALHCAWR